MLVLSTRIVLDCFYLLILYSEKFSTDVCRLSYAVNVNLNLSILYLYTCSLVPRRSLLTRCPREGWEREKESLSVTSQFTVESRIDLAEND